MKKLLIVVLTTFGLVLGMGGPMLSTAEAKRPHHVVVQAEANDALIMQGEYVYINGKVKRGGADSKVLLQRRIRKHGHWQKVDASRTHNGGRFSVQDDSKKAKQTRWYRVVRPASGHGPRAASKLMKVKVVPWDGRIE